MTKFLNGPAAGTILQLARAPLFLRAVQAPDGTLDALDDLGDKPKAEEKITVYRRVGNAGHMHLCGRTPTGKRWGGWYAVAEYKVVDDQPDDATMRGTESWRAWCEKQVNAEAQK